MSRRTRPVGRRRPVRRPAVRIVVATEGSSTEPAYLRALNRLFVDESVRLELVSGVGDPRAVVEQAIEELAKSERDLLGNDDSAWAMFDRDAHDRLPRRRIWRAATALDWLCRIRVSSCGEYCTIGTRKPRLIGTNASGCSKSCVPGTREGEGSYSAICR